jgi:putative NADPH-quinone reductase
MDLYNSDLKLDFLTFDSKDNEKNVLLRQSKILESDELVFAFPMRW